MSLHDLRIDEIVGRSTLPLADPVVYEQFVANNLDLIAFADVASQHATGSPEGVSEWVLVHIVKVLLDVQESYER